MIPLYDFKRPPSAPLVHANVTRQRYPKVEQRTFQSLFISVLLDDFSEIRQRCYVF